MFIRPFLCVYEGDRYKHHKNVYINNLNIMMLLKIISDWFEFIVLFWSRAE